MVYRIIIMLLFSININSQILWDYVSLNNNIFDSIVAFDTTGEDVFIMYWQSNMNGQFDNDSISVYPDRYDYPVGDTTAWIFSNYVTTWDTLSYTNSRTTESYTQYSGPELWFALKYKETYGKEPYIIKYAPPGTSMYSDWNPDSTSNAFDSLFRQDNSILNNAIDSILTNRGVSNYNIVGLIGIGFERDLVISNLNIQTDFERFIDSSYNYTQPNVPHIFNRICINYGSTGSENIPIVRTACDNIKNTKANCRYTNSDDLDFRDGVIHFNNISTKILAERLFDEWKIIIDNM